MSDPPLGSDRSCIHSSSPRSIRGRCRCFSSSEPWSSSVAAIIPIDTMYPAGMRRPISTRVEEHLLVLEREPGAAVLLRERDACEAGVEDLLLQLLIGEGLVALVGEVLVDPRACTLAERLEALHVDVDALGHEPPLSAPRSAQIRSLCSSGEPYTARLTATRRE